MIDNKEQIPDNLVVFRKKPQTDLPAVTEPVVKTIPITAVKHCQPRCQAISVNEHTRTVTCRSCGKVHDPFDWLVAISKWESDVFRHTESLRDALRETERRVTEAERVERNIKARLRAMRDKLEDTRQELAESVSVVEAKAQMRELLKDTK